MNDTSVYYKNQILDAIEAIVKNAVDTAPFDRTIQGTVLELLDESLGKYRIKYQDSYFEAYSKNLNIKYNKNTLVQILIPRNDMAETKIILNTVQEDTFENTAIDTSDMYENSLTNLFTNTNTDKYSVCSWKGNDIETLYSKDGENKVDFSEDVFKEGLLESDGFTVRAKIQTLLEQIGGNYGITFQLAFKNDAGEPYIKKYVFDTTKMIGKPYNFNNYSQQECIFELGEALNEYQWVDSIYIFANDFPNAANNKPDDIFFKDLELYTTKKLTEEQLRSNNIVLNRSKMYFSKKNQDEQEELKDQTMDIEALLYKGKTKINTAGQTYEYYWFKENPAITSQNENYVNYGGSGWECINLKNNGKWITNTNYITLNKEDNIHFRNKHKIIVIDENQIFAAKEFDVYNYMYQGEAVLSISSTQGTKFYYGNGSPQLQLLINGNPLSAEDKENATFIWNYTNELSKETYAIDNASDILPFNKMDWTNFRDTNITYTYACAYYNQDGVWQGSAYIGLENQVGQDVLSQYYIDIDKENFIYSYSNEGISPAHEGLDHPQKINPLVVNLKDPENQNISPDSYQITWTISPTEDKGMLINKNENNTEKNKFIYGIAEIYNYRKINNNKITVSITYKNYVYTKDVYFNFVKDGEPGFNQDSVFCKIYPNIEDAIIDYPSIIIKNGIKEFNFTPIENEPNFKIKLWDGGNYITEENYTVQWNILKRFAGVGVDNEAPSLLKLENGQIILNNNENFDSTKWDDYANIIKATISYNGKEYYCTLPIITINLEDDDYNIGINPDTGYRYVQYANSGKSPQYDNTTPFEINLLDQNEEIITENVNINWDFTNQTLEQNEENQIIPLPSYHGDDIYTSAMFAEIQLENQVIGQVHIPIHMYLDKLSIAALDSWDGNSIVLDDKKNIILSPQVIAGKKEDSGYFSGVFVGDLSSADYSIHDGQTIYNSTTESGLFGYKNGNRTFEINSNTGKITLGSAQGGQIIMDPGEEGDGGSTIIRTGDFTRDGEGKGMEINMSSPSITWGNGNFEVDANGNLTASNAALNGATISGGEIEIINTTTGRTTVIGTEGVLSLLQFSSYQSYVGWGPVTWGDDTGTAEPHGLSLMYTIPSNFQVVNAFIVFTHSPIDYYYDVYNPNTYESSTASHRSYATNVKLYKATNFNTIIFKQKGSGGEPDYNSISKTLMTWNYTGTNIWNNNNGFTGSSSSASVIKTNNLINNNCFSENNTYMLIAVPTGTAPSSSSQWFYGGQCQMTLYVLGYYQP